MFLVEIIAMSLRAKRFVS